MNCLLDFGLSLLIRPWARLSLAICPSSVEGEREQHIINLHRLRCLLIGIARRVLGEISLGSFDHGSDLMVGVERGGCACEALVRLASIAGVFSQR